MWHYQQKTNMAGAVTLQGTVQRKKNTFYLSRELWNLSNSTAALDANI